MFVGQYQFTLDTKKRLVLPAKFRSFFPSGQDEIGVYVTVRALYQTGAGRAWEHNRMLFNYLAIYPESAWEKYTEEWMTNPAIQKEKERELLKLSSSTEFCKIDSQWRIVLPLRLINEGELKRNIMITGVLDHIRVWDLEKWRRVSQWLVEYPTNFVPPKRD